MYKLGVWGTAEFAFGNGTNYKQLETDQFKQCEYIVVGLT